ncbi:3-hydroxyacyl-CoA dehydrogenase family protein [Lentzea sp. NPDC054927]
MRCVAAIPTVGGLVAAVTGELYSCGIAVVGAGTMGIDISALFLSRGVPVHLIDVDQAVIADAGTRVERQLRHARLLGAAPDVDRGALTTGHDLAGIGEPVLVIEAVTESPEVKRAVLGELSGAGRPLVTNTSGIPVDELAGALGRPELLVGAHFMNPAYLIAMVEVVRGPRTGQAALDAVLAVLGAVGRRAIVVADGPGFVTSRLLHPMINDAVRVLEAGTAGADDIDALMQGCLGHPAGPLRTADLIGLDNLVDSLSELHERTGDEGCRPAGLLLEKVRAGELGRKSGRGFYDYGKAMT